MSKKSEGAERIVSFRTDNPVWTGSSMDPMGNWFDVDEPMVTSTFIDMRKESGGTWVPPDSVLNVNVSETI